MSENKNYPERYVLGRVPGVEGDTIVLREKDVRVWLTQTTQQRIDKLSKQQEQWHKKHGGGEWCSEKCLDYCDDCETRIDELKIQLRRLLGNQEAEGGG